jgi:hypothetical protein
MENDIPKPRKMEIYFRGTEKALIRIIAVGVAAIIILLAALILVERNRPIEVYITPDQAKHLLGE